MALYYPQPIATNPPSAYMLKHMNTSPNSFQEAQQLLTKFKDEDAEIAGILVYDSKTDEIVASTYSEEQGKKLVVVRKKYEKLGEEAVAEGVYPPGRWNWGMTSVARYTLFGTNLVGDYVMAGEFEESKAPSACIEDALELSLMVNDLLPARV